MIDPVRAALGSAGRLGGFFRLTAEVGPQSTSWEDLVGDPAVLRRRTDEVGRLLGPAAEARVVASLVHLGVVARALSPAIGAALTSGVLPVPAGIHLHLAGANPVPMAWSGVEVVATPTPADAATALVRHWLRPRITPWTDRVAATGVPPRVLAGNTVSAVAGAVVLAAAARPHLAAPGAALVDALTATGPLAGSGQRRPDGSFVRRSCCLFYRLPGAGYCGDCVLDR